MSTLTFLRLSTAVCWPVAAIFAAPLQAVTEPAAPQQHHAIHQHQQKMDHPQQHHHEHQHQHKKDHPQQHHHEHQHQQKKEHPHEHQHQHKMDHPQPQRPVSQAAAVEPVVAAPTALADLMPAAMVPLQDWRQANQQVLRLGGWQFYLQEAAAAAPVTPHAQEVKEQPHAHH